MKILFFIDTLRAGGKERRMTELLKALHTYPGIECELVLMDEEVHYKEVLALGIKIHYLIRKTKKDQTVFKKFYSICKEFKPDLIHCWGSMPAMYALPAVVLLKIKLINGMVTNTPVTRNILNKHWLRAKLTFPFSHLIIGNSWAGLRAYKAPLKKSICIYNGIDLKRFDNLNDTGKLKAELFNPIIENVFVVGMVAAFENRKDFNTLIKAAILLLPRFENLRFVLVGDGTNLGQVKNMVPDEYKDRILFPGRKKSVEPFIKLFDISVLLTNTHVHGEGVSNSIIEYMALEKPVIATRGGGTDEAVHDGVSGYLIDSFDHAKLAEKIIELMYDSQKRNEMGKQGCQIVKEKFDINLITDKYLNEYKGLLKKEKS